MTGQYNYFKYYKQKKMQQKYFLGEKEYDLENLRKKRRFI